MLDYMATTETNGELPLYIPGVYEEALATGALRGSAVSGER
jgi:hypothetical protein